MVRTSTAEVDRRLSGRCQVDLPCRLTVPGQAACTARISDISAGGACVRGGPPLPPGARGTLQVDGVGSALGFTARQTVDETLHLAFETGAATPAGLAALLERMARQAAA